MEYLKIEQIAKKWDIFEAEVAYSRGEIDKVYESANYLLGKHSGLYAVLSTRQK